VLTDYRADPLVHHGRPTLGLSTAVVGQFEMLPKRARGLRLPVLMQYGTVDAIVDATGFRRLESCCGSADLTVRRYEGLWHEIYNEPERDGPLTDLREWLTARA
jgi:alpha-beta hydrolase superfamily lysophospholipase